MGHNDLRAEEMLDFSQFKNQVNNLMKEKEIFKMISFGNQNHESFLYYEIKVITAQLFSN